MLKYIAINLNPNHEVLKLSQQSTINLGNSFALGLGWMMDKNWNGEQYIFHTGAGFGGHSAVYMYPSKQMGIIIFVNEKVSQNKVNALEKYISHAINIYYR